MSLSDTKILDELSGHLLPRLFMPSPDSGVIVNRLVLSNLTLDATIALPKSAWSLHLVLSQIVTDFIRQLHNDLRILDHTTRSQMVLNAEGSVRGRIDVPNTLRIRAQRGKPWIAHDDVLPTSQTPENELLKVVLFDLEAMIRPMLNHFTSEELQVSIRRAHSEIRTALGHPFVDLIEVPTMVSTFMLQAARRSKVPLIHMALQIYMQNLRFQSGDPSVFVDLIHDRLIYPKNSDRLFEFYVLAQVVAALDEIPGANWTARHFGVAEELTVARFRSEKCTVRVWYNISPGRALKWASGYRWQYNSIFDMYEGVDVSSRRPDIIVEFTNEVDKRVVLLIEVKNTTNSNYIRDAVYKAIGYIDDFRLLWQPPTVDINGIPRAIVVTTGGIRPIEPLTWSQAWLNRSIGILAFPAANRSVFIDNFAAIVNSFADA